MKKIKSFGWGYVILGILLAAIGICFIIFQNAFTVLAIAMGIILAAAGAVIGALTLVKKERGAGFVLKIIFAVLCITGGIVTAVMRDSSIPVIANVFFILIIVDGSFKLNLAIMSKRFSFFGWWVMLVASIVLIVGTFILTKLSYSSQGTLSVLAGIAIAFDGIMNVLSAFWNSALGARIDSADVPDMPEPPDEE